MSTQKKIRVFLPFLILIWGFCAVPYAEEALPLDKKTLPGLLQTFDEIAQYVIQNGVRTNRFEEEGLAEIQDALARKGVYDTQLNLLFNYDDDAIPQTNPFAPTGQKLLGGGVRLEKRLPYGATLGVSHGLDKNDLSFIDSTQSGISTKNTFLRGEARIHLWKNIFGIQDRAFLREITRREEVEEFDIRSRTENFIFQIGDSVLLILTQQDQILNQSRRCKRFKELYDLTQRRARNRLVEKKSLLQAKAQHEGCKVELQSRELTLNNLRNILISQMTPSEPAKRKELASELVWLEITSNEIIGTPESRNPELVLKRSDLQVARLVVLETEERITRKKHNLYPELDLTGGIQLSGQDPNSIGKAYKEIGSADFDSYHVGLTLSVPLERTRAKKQYKAENFRLSAQKKYFYELQKSLEKDLKNAIAAIETRKKLWDQFDGITQSEKVRIELMQRDYRLGRIDTQQLFEAESDLTDALDARAREKFLFHRAILDYFLLTGRMLTDFST